MRAQIWNKIISTFPEPHILQTWEWGQVKANFGWKPIPLLWLKELEGQGDVRLLELDNPNFASADQVVTEELDTNHPVAANLLLERTLTIGGFAARLKILYSSKGPLLYDWEDQALRNRVLEDLRRQGQKRGAIFVKIDPDVPLGLGVPDTSEAEENPVGSSTLFDLKRAGWQFSEEQVQYRNTVLVDLTPSEDEMLARMKQKTRYNVRLAGRRGVSVRVGTQADLDLLYQMYIETSLRDGFVIRGRDYYLKVWKTFLDAHPIRMEPSALPIAEPLIAEVEGVPVAALVIFRFAGCAWYLHGMSRTLQRKKMPNYLLQWEAMRRAKDAGCREYDLWGAPDEFDESDPMWGVYRFKSGLGGEVRRTIGAWDLPIRTSWFWLYKRLLPRLLDIMRRFGIARTKKSHEEEDRIW